MKCLLFLSIFLSVLPRKSLKDNCNAFIDVSAGIGIGILFAGLMVIAYIIWTLRDTLLLPVPTGNATTNPTGWANYWAENGSRSSIGNLTSGFDNTVTLLLVVIVIWLLALAIMALLVIKKKAE